MNEHSELKKFLSSCPFVVSKKHMKCDICNSFKIKAYQKVQIKNYILDLYRCQSCNFVFQEDYKNIKLSYDDNYYLREKIIDAGFLKKKAKYKYNLLKPYFKNSKKILEIGSSTGEFLEVCKKNGYNVTGLEISNIAVKTCEEKGLQVINAGIESLSSQNKKFDAVIMFDVIEHLTDINNFFIELKKISNPNAVIIIETPNHNSILRLLNPYKWVGYNKYHLTYFNPFNLTMIMKKLGFNKIDIKTSEIDICSLNFWKRTLPYHFISSFIKKIIKSKLKKEKTYFPLVNKYNFNSKKLYGDEMIGIFVYN